MYHSVIGQQGSGKTTLLTLLGLEDERYKDREIYSNFWIDSDRYKPLEVDDLNDIPNGTLVLLDELLLWMEVRISGFWLNQYISYIINSSRKRDVDIFGTYQLGRMIDVRLLEQTKYLVKCLRMDNGNPDRELWDFKWVWFDLWENTFATFFIKYGDVTPLFSKFNSYQILRSVHDKSYEFKLKKLNPEKFYPELKKISKKVKDSIDVVTHDSVRLALTLNGYPESLERDVYGFLKGYVKKN